MPLITCIVYLYITISYSLKNNCCDENRKTMADNAYTAAVAAFCPGCNIRLRDVRANIRVPQSHNVHYNTLNNNGFARKLYGIHLYILM
jgi:hypothetical protein